MMKTFVILQGVLAVNIFDRFFTTNHENPETMADGTVAYKVIGYADSVAEAQMKLYGRVINP